MLFHKDVYFPKPLIEWINRQKPNRLTLYYDNNSHAIRESLNDRYGNILLPSFIELSICDFIEIEVIDNKVNKLVLRIPYNSKYDLTIVVLLCGTVKTVWLNEKTDNHKTLDISKYEQPK